MKNLSKFQKHQITKEDSTNIKGGLRFFTYSESMYNAVRGFLTSLAIHFSHGHEVEADGRRHFCIEW